MNTLWNIFFSRVFLKKKENLEEYRVESLRSYKEHYIIKLEGVDSLSRARELVGLEVQLPEDSLQSLEGDNYYSFQIIGCSVVTQSGKQIGNVSDLIWVKDNNLLVVTHEEKEILIPFTHSVCLEVDLKQKIIRIDPPEGLLELNEI
ncbi:MAG: 16S rRNA processing protein RimM [Candidatus Aminicenantes bacterium]|nr:MAG: 16S rRNA processing protein RimM [Candidatus Aminicenantes bacterium]